MDFWKPLKEDLKEATKWVEETKQKEQEKTMQKGGRCFTLIIVMCHSLPVWYYIEQKNKTQRQKRKERETIFTWEILTFLIPAGRAWLFCLRPMPQGFQQYRHERKTLTNRNCEWISNKVLAAKHCRSSLMAPHQIQGLNCAKPIKKQARKEDLWIHAAKDSTCFCSHCNSFDCHIFLLTKLQRTFSGHQVNWFCLSESNGEQGWNCSTALAPFVRRKDVQRVCRKARCSKLSSLEKGKH